MGFEFPNKPPVEKKPEEQITPEEKALLREKIGERFQALKKQKEGILAWNEVTPDDRVLLEKIESEMEDLKEQFNTVGRNNQVEQPKVE